jgi:hypothetical protein
MGGIFRKVTIGALEAQMRNANLLETGFTTQTHLFHCRSIVSNQQWSALQQPILFPR